jgi:protein arginine kinase activator
VEISITHEGPVSETQQETTTACPRCQLSFLEFKTKGRLGCCDCYRHFEKDIDSLLMQVHGSTVHKGKLYRHGGPDKLDVKDMERLKSELSEAIEKEEFELAALIRDTLHSFNAQNAGEALDQSR